jgi:uncharacterized protein YutE (UPF0331/DUF86 family)
LPETNRGVFRALSELELIDATLSRRLEDMAGFRNLLVHGYASVVPTKVHAAPAELDDVREYLRQIGSALSPESQEG